MKLDPNGDLIFSIKVAGPGRIDVLETAWNDNFAQAAVLLQPARRRFVFARSRATAHHAGRLRVRVIPYARGRRLLAHHRYRVTLRLWVTFTPIGGATRAARSIGIYHVQRRRRR